MRWLLFTLAACSPPAIDLPDGSPGIGFDDLQYSPRLHRVLAPGGLGPSVLTAIRVGGTRIAVPVAGPSGAGAAWNDGTSMIGKCGANETRSAAAGRRNRLRAKMLAQAVSV